MTCYDLNTFVWPPLCQFNPRTPWDWTTKNDLAYSNDLFFKIKIKKKKLNGTKMIHHIFTQNYLLLNSMTFDKFHNGRLHLILKTALILFINNYPTLEANVIRFLKFMTLNLILCVLNLTKLILKSIANFNFSYLQFIWYKYLCTYERCLHVQ